MYSVSTQIHRWLSSTADSDQPPLHPATRNLHCDRAEDIAYEARQCKRRKIHHSTLPSPPSSQFLTRTAMSASAGRKRTRDDRDDDPSLSEPSNPELLDEVHSEETPPASKFLLMQHRELSGRDSPSQPFPALKRLHPLCLNLKSLSLDIKPIITYKTVP